MFLQNLENSDLKFRAVNGLCRTGNNHRKDWLFQNIRFSLTFAHWVSIVRSDNSKIGGVGFLENQDLN